MFYGLTRLQSPRVSSQLWSFSPSRAYILGDLSGTARGFAYHSSLEAYARPLVMQRVQQGTKPPEPSVNYLSRLLPLRQPTRSPSCLRFLSFRQLANREQYVRPIEIKHLVHLKKISTDSVPSNLAHNDTDSKTPYIIQSTLILVAPILFAASVYMILGRLILRTGSASYSIVRATWVTKIFVAGDILCFMIQGGGAGLLVSSSDADGFKRGENIILGGLILQIMIFAFFVLVAGIWHRRLSARPTGAAAELPWKKYIIFLYGASVCITVRNVCRVIEYAMGKVRLSASQTLEVRLTILIGRVSSIPRVASLRLRLPADGYHPRRVRYMVRPEYQTWSQDRH